MSTFAHCAYLKQLVLSISGHTALHYAAAWGKINTVKALIENGANVHTKTTNTDERARDVASRYEQLECVDYLDWAGEWTVILTGQVSGQLP